MDAYKPNSVIDSYLSVSPVARRIKRHSSPHLHEAGTALHSRKYFAVSAGLNRVISVLNSRVTPDRRYLLRFPAPLSREK